MVGLTVTLVDAGAAAEVLLGMLDERAERGRLKLTFLRSCGAGRGVWKGRVVADDKGACVRSSLGKWWLRGAGRAGSEEPEIVGKVSALEPPAAALAWRDNGRLLSKGSSRRGGIIEAKDAGCFAAGAVAGRDGPCGVEPNVGRRLLYVRCGDCSMVSRVGDAGAGAWTVFSDNGDGWSERWPWLVEG